MNKLNNLKIMNMKNIQNMKPYLPCNETIAELLNYWGKILSTHDLILLALMKLEIMRKNTQHK